MSNEESEIDFERLRSDLYDEYMGAYFGGGFGVALTEAEDVLSASRDELVSFAEDLGLDLSKYELNT